jgi:hypothetical protein
MNRQMIKPLLASALLLLGFVASGAAMAQHRHGGHFGVYLGVPFYGLGYYPPYYSPYYSPYYASPYYYPPAVVVPSSPPVYVEQGLAQAAPPPAQAQAQGDWFYCAASRSYYPYAAECPAGWQRVPAQPPSR